MTNAIEFYENMVRRALKAHNLYTKSLEMQIYSLASAMRALEIANCEIDGLDKATVLESTRYGEKLAPHPVFKVAKDAQDMITRQMKALGLTAEDLAGDVEEDPLVDLTKRLTKRRTQAKIVHPDSD